MGRVASSEARVSIVTVLCAYDATPKQLSSKTIR